MEIIKIQAYLFAERHLTFYCQSRWKGPPYPPVGGLTYGLMLRDLALSLVNRLKKNIFLMNVPLIWLPPEAFSSPKCTKYRLVVGLRADPLGELTSLLRSPSWI